MAQLSWRKMSRYLHQSFDVQARPESAVPVRDFGRSLQNRDNFCCPGINVNRFMRKPGQRANSRIGLIPPIPSARRYELRKPECPGSRKQAEIADRDSGFCPGRQVKRLTYEPGQIQIREKPMKQI